MSDPLLVSPAAAAELLGVSRATVYALIHEGSIPSLRLTQDGRLRVPLEELRRRLDELVAWGPGGEPVPMAAGRNGT